ncbi:hypothetical protein CCHR01_18465 [Colletotrichum chrysophilum]|uniref:Uncharacterized protein n=1 Tax=Colletotrichum chrysophilum TaxID=1836956 RepID=A0AAD9A025_9PEZI|nr:hypothetical protein CCHR01_18465 [Colletotrichum chrysophilum]
MTFSEKMRCRAGSARPPSLSSGALCCLVDASQTGKSAHPRQWWHQDQRDQHTNTQSHADAVRCGVPTGWGRPWQGCLAFISQESWPPKMETSEI